MSKVNNNYKILYLDIETSPCLGFFWRPGSKVNIGHNNIVEERQIILASYAWNNEKPKTIRWKKDPKSTNKYIKYCDKNVVEAIIAEMDKADLIVTQNGDRFDVTWIRGRSVKHRIPMGHNYPSFDTLKKSRHYLNLNSNRLDYLGHFFLGEGKVSTGGFQLWVDCINGSKKAMDKMAKYCEGDINLLRRYHKHLLQYVPANNHVGASLGFAKHMTCPTCGTYDIRLSKQYTTKVGNIRNNMKCVHGHPFTISHTDYLKWVKETRGE